MNIAILNICQQQHKVTDAPKNDENTARPRGLFRSGLLYGALARICNGDTQFLRVYNQLGVFSMTFWCAGR